MVIACGGMLACGRMMACGQMMTWSHVMFSLWLDDDDADDAIIFRVTQENEILRHQVSLLRFSVMQCNAVCTVLHN